MGLCLSLAFSSAARALQPGKPGEPHPRWRACVRVSSQAGAGDIEPSRPSPEERGRGTLGTRGGGATPEAQTGEEKVCQVEERPTRKDCGISAAGLFLLLLPGRKAAGRADRQTSLGVRRGDDVGRLRVTEPNR